jgi:hypothetical protein
MTKDQLTELFYERFYMGADPEIFITDAFGNVIPAFEFLPDKSKPLLSKHDERYGDNLPIYWDGFQAEFNTTAQSCIAWPVDSVASCLKALSKAAIAFKPGAKLLAKPTVNVSREALVSPEDKHVEFGCTPSKNAYGMNGLFIPGRECNSRSAGGHIHFGTAYLMKGMSPAQIDNVIKVMDSILGVIGVSMFQSFDDPARRTMYGLAGEYRLPPHGIEYRTLSNAWIYHPAAMNLIFNLARSVMTLALKDKANDWIAKEEEVIHCINTCDVSLAQRILFTNDSFLREIILASYPNLPYLLDVTLETIYNGVESVIPDYTNIEKNWDVNGRWITHSEGEGKNWNGFCYQVTKQQTKVG